MCVVCEEQCRGHLWAVHMRHSSHWETFDVVSYQCNKYIHLFHSVILFPFLFLHGNLLVLFATYMRHGTHQGKDEGNVRTSMACSVHIHMEHMGRTLHTVLLFDTTITSRLVPRSIRERRYEVTPFRLGACPHILASFGDNIFFTAANFLPFFAFGYMCEGYQVYSFQNTRILLNKTS